MRIYARAPLRLSLFGGGTDLPAYYKKHGGLTIDLAINLYQELQLRTGYDIYRGLTELPYDADPKLCYAILRCYGLGSWHHATVRAVSDAFLGSGLGTSGAFSVALVAAIERLQNHKRSLSDIAEMAYRIEKSLWTTGKQDHYAAAHGGLRVYLFEGNQAQTLTFDKRVSEGLRPWLHLIYTGGKRNSGTKQLKHMTARRVKHLTAIKRLAEQAHLSLMYEDFHSAAELMHESWIAKRALGTSSEKIDDIYDSARKLGAVGGKLLGAGGSGYMLFMVPPKKGKKFTQAMAANGLEETDFGIDYNGVQTRIL